MRSELLLNSIYCIYLEETFYKNKFAFRVAEEGSLITKPPAIKTVYENRITKTRPVVTKKDKRTQPNFPNFVGFIDFLISGPQKRSKTNHVKSRIGLQRRRRIGIENYLSQNTEIRDSRIEKYFKSNKPVSPINPNKLSAKIIKPGLRNNLLVENYDFTPQQKSLTRRKLRTETEFRNPHSSPAPPSPSSDVISASSRPAFKLRKDRTASRIPEVSQNHHSRNQKLNQTNFLSPDEFPPRQQETQGPQEIIFVPQEMYETNFSSDQRKTLSSRPSYPETKPKQNIVRKRQGTVDQTISVSPRNYTHKTERKIHPNLLKKRHSSLLKKDKEAELARDEEEPVFEFETKVSVSLDSNGYLMTIILISQIIIFGMVLYSRSLHDAKSNASSE